MINRATNMAIGLGLAAALSAGAPAAAQEIKSRTGTSLTVGARVQAQYEASSTDDANSSFFIRRAWVTFDGRLNDLVRGRAQFNVDGASVLEAYLAIAPSEAFELQIGQFKRGVSSFWFAANFDLPIIERDGRVTGVDHCPGVGGVCSYGRVTSALGLDTYEPGLLATGRFGGRFGYRVTLTNGEGIGSKDVNGGKSASGRLSLFLPGNGRVSAYLAMDETLDSAGESMGVPAYGAEVEFGTWRQGPHIIVNGLTGRNWKLDDDASFSAFQLMGFWYLPFSPTSKLAGIEPMLRFSWVDSGADPTKVTGTVVTPGVMVYFVGRNGISTNLDLYRSGDRSDWSLKLQAFTFF